MGLHGISFSPPFGERVWPRNSQGKDASNHVIPSVQLGTYAGVVLFKGTHTQLTNKRALYQYYTTEDHVHYASRDLTKFKVLVHTKHDQGLVSSGLVRGWCR